MGQDSGTVQGRVTDTQTDRPLVTALVQATNSDGRVVAGALTNLEGRYLLSLQPGSYRLSVAALEDVRDVNFQTKMVNVESEAHLQRERLTAKKTDLVAALRKDPTNAALKQQVTEVAEDIKRYNLDAKYYVNAIALDGKIGLLKLGSRAFKALKAEIDLLRKANVDPLSIDQGRFFNFRRTNDTGNFQDTSYQVTVYKETVVKDGETYEKAKVHVIDQAIIDRLSDEAFELSGMYPVVTAAQVKRMVEEGASAVDEILGGDNDRGAADDEEGESQAASTQAAAPKVEAAVVSTPAPAAVAATEKITPAAVAASTEVAAPAAKGDLSEDDFLRSIGALK
jgi:hypothetical protein